MKPNRLEAFSNGVLEIVITIMVLEMKAPHGAALSYQNPVPHLYLLSLEFHLCGDLLEQPPPLMAGS